MTQITESDNYCTSVWIATTLLRWCGVHVCSCTHGGHLSYQLLSSFKDVNSPHNQISDAGPPREVGLCWQEHADCGVFFCPDSRWFWASTASNTWDLLSQGAAQSETRPGGFLLTHVWKWFFFNLCSTSITRDCRLSCKEQSGWCWGFEGMSVNLPCSDTTTRSFDLTLARGQNSCSRFMSYR